MSEPTPPDLSAELLAAMQALLPPDLKDRVPPPCFKEMEASFLDYEDGIRLVVRIPNHPRYQNPLGFMQGGFITAAVDNTMGPLSFLASPPNVTTQLDVSFLRPVAATDAYIDVDARVVHKTRRNLLMTAEVKNPKGALVAWARATCQVIELGEGGGRP